MQFSDLEPPYQAFVRDLLGRFGFDADKLQLQIPERDEMFFRGVLPGYPGRPGAAFHRYVESSLRTFDIYRQLAEFAGGFESLERVLDFGSGHGRLTRLLAHHLEPRRIWVCDIYPEAVAWQVEAFGVNGLVSATHPDRFALDLNYPIIFAGSVFSHLPDGLFQAWLARLYRLLEPDGLLAFTVHDAGFAPAEQTVTESGIGFARESESETLDPAIYGMSYVTEAYVAAAIAAACGLSAARNVRRFPRAVYENQDLYVVGGPEVDVAELEVLATPIGGFRKVDSSARAWSGWGIDPNARSELVKAELFLEHRAVASQVPAGDQPDVMAFFPGNPNVAKGWTFDIPQVDRDTLVRVELTSSAGTRAHCYALASPSPGAATPRG